MVIRNHWLRLIEALLSKRNVLWLSGARRAGKTTLCQSIPGVEYLDCELLSTRRMMEDSESFLKRFGSQRLVLDEIHRLANPSELLKIAADHFPALRIIATGSSTLQASRKFRDTLTGRKYELHLTPLIEADREMFPKRPLEHRLQMGGLPPFYLEETFPERAFQEWMDSFWAKDIQELFRIENRAGFQKFFELLLIDSGGIFEATRFAKTSEVSRTSILNYLHALEATGIMQVVRPFSTHRSTEIVLAPRVYAFDTGFVCWARNWHPLRPEDKGILWEHIVLNEILALAQGSLSVRYWRTKGGSEVDFIVEPRGRDPIALECKWSADHADAAGFRAFRRLYPKGENWIVASDVAKPYEKRMGDVSVRFFPLEKMSTLLTPLLPAI